MESLAFVDVRGGMNAADPPKDIAPNQVARMVNCALVQGLPTTRIGTRVVPLSGGVAETLAVNNNQGSIFFNPAEGQGGIVLSESLPKILVAVGGRKYTVQVKGRRENSAGEVVDITAGHVTSKQRHLVWWVGAEDLAIAQDGQSNCWIWDAVNGSRFSAGYNTKDKLKSKIPNGGTVMAYAHNRIVAVVNSRYILVGDNLHRTDNSSSKNLEDFVEQVYWATGQYFLPPTSIGNILAAVNMATPGETNDGYAGLWFHLEDGLFSLNLNVYPRSNWSNLPLVKTALDTPGARGPYAVAIVKGDQVFLSRDGLSSLRWAIGNGTTDNPIQSLSEEVACWLKQDYPRWLRFASVAVWKKERRVVVTTGPIVNGRFRWHRGFVVRNGLVSKTTLGASPAWEGLWTLHPQAAGVVQFVGGNFDGEERQFAWVRGNDGRNRLVEFCANLRDDIKEDGSRVRIPCQVITRAMDAGKWWESREYVKGSLYLANISGEIDWGVWIRPVDTAEWTFWKGGKASNPIAAGENSVVENVARPLEIHLGKVPMFAECDKAEGRMIQCLVRWAGYCSFQGILFDIGGKDMTNRSPNQEQLNVTFGNSDSRDYDDFEYCEAETPSWISIK